MTTARVPSGARRRVLWYAFTLAIITYLDRVCISAAAPAIMADLQLSVLQMSIVFSAFTLAYSLFEVPSGWMADVIGSRRVLTRIVLWWSVFTILTGQAWSYVSLVTMRFLFGAGEAGAFPSISRSFSRWFPPRERGRANGILFLGSRIGGAIAPGLSFLIIQQWGWRTSFVVFGSTGFVWAALWYRWYRDEPADHPEVTPEELAWIHERAPGTSDAAAAGPAANPSGGMAPGDRAVPWRAIFMSRNIAAICGMYFAFGYGLYFYFTWLPTYLTTVLGFSIAAGGLFAGLPFVLAGIADIVGGHLTDRLSARHGLKVGRTWLGSASFLGCASLLLASTSIDHPVAQATLLALALASADLGLSACWAVCLDVGRHHAGVVTGLMNTFGNLGGVVGPIVVGYVVGTWGSWTIPFVITAGVYTIGALLWLAVDPTRTVTSVQPAARA